MTFEELEHTADVRMKIIAPTFADLLSESGFALSATLYGAYSRETPVAVFPLTAEGRDLPELLVNFLSELLFLMETEYLVPQIITADVSGTTVSGTVAGVAFDREKHAGGIGVKGISYSGLSLRQTPMGYELIIIFDI